MPELVWVEVRYVVPISKLFEIASRCLGIHYLWTSFLSKYIAANSLFGLLCSKLLQYGEDFGADINASGLAVLGRSKIHPGLRRVLGVSFNGDGGGGPVNI